MTAVNVGIASTPLRNGLAFRTVSIKMLTTWRACREFIVTGKMPEKTPEAVAARDTPAAAGKPDAGGTVAEVGAAAARTAADAAADASDAAKGAAAAAVAAAGEAKGAAGTPTFTSSLTSCALQGHLRGLFTA